MMTKTWSSRGIAIGFLKAEDAGVTAVNAAPAMSATAICFNFMVVPLEKTFAGRAGSPLRLRIYWRGFVADCRRFRDGIVMIAQRVRDRGTDAVRPQKGWNKSAAFRA